MSGIGASIRHNLGGLLSFSGRQTPAQFWPYAIGLYLLSMIAGMAIAIPAMVRMMTNLQQYIAAHPHGLPPPAPGQLPGLPPGLMPDFSGMAVPMAATNIVLVLLLAAAIVRRLHDRDRTGL